MPGDPIRDDRGCFSADFLVQNTRLSADQEQDYRVPADPLASPRDRSFSVPPISTFPDTAIVMDSELSRGIDQKGVTPKKVKIMKKIVKKMHTKLLHKLSALFSVESEAEDELFEDIQPHLRTQKPRRSRRRNPQQTAELRIAIRQHFQDLTGDKRVQWRSFLATLAKNQQRFINWSKDIPFPLEENWSFNTWTGDELQSLLDVEVEDWPDSEPFYSFNGILYLTK